MPNTKCPQCGSEGCGPYRCRFSGNTHELFRANTYADAAIKRDAEQPRWLSDMRQGSPDTKPGYP